ncbi:hypothetical protein SASPL_101849 [Salvia splendens]|uniref:Nodulin homeobox N-terminal domain-containing protein n=1 Tax=Salvia splendens TaxID=180675 RepID=A0A8X8YQ18_SALSN|nr:hypothetical protein SASPL_101849 [Salvia splendens]
MDYINIGTGVTTLRTETLVEAVMNLKLSGSDNISSYMASISRLKSKALSILLQLCETESVSYLDEVASNTTTQNMAKSVGLEVLALLVKAWNRFKTGTGCSHYGRFLELSAGRSLACVILVQGICWLGTEFKGSKSKATNNDFLSIADDTAAGATGQLELLSTAIMDGWMAGLGAAQPPTTDALGQLLSEYSRYLYTSQLQHLKVLMWFVMVHILISTVILVHKDIAGTLATEAAEDSAQVAKLRSALESVDHKRRKILQQMKNDAEMLNLESGAAPIRSPSTSAEDARLVSLISLDSILKQVKVFHLSPISHLLTFWQMSQMLQLFCHSS